MYNRRGRQFSNCGRRFRREQGRETLNRSDFQKPETEEKGPRKFYIYTHKQTRINTHTEREKYMQCHFFFVALVTMKNVYRNAFVCRECFSFFDEKEINQQRRDLFVPFFSFVCRFLSSSNRTCPVFCHDNPVERRPR